VEVPHATKAAGRSGALHTALDAAIMHTLLSPVTTARAMVENTAWMLLLPHARSHDVAAARRAAGGISRGDAPVATE
jgi:hypothetical protein